ncbi:acyl-CoA thioesterase [Azospirillum griseum]|uniref:Acyl-CoA thioesterase n=1 Tax=Azospirillum griseum TaxID=2496639 RepID=A0A431VME4_9PROT|nr:thioesterase family protein [Azospirillum griseum]RTR23636.1 acyl-CoA thioesterase [Azospirillum griseum]
MTTPPTPADFPRHTHDKLRYADTDRQGHVNNAVFATLFETGRVELLYDPAGPLHAENGAFVIARLAIDFVDEIRWPGAVDIATRVASLGRSSIRLEQALFQDGRHVASAESVIVHVDQGDRRSRPLPPAAVAVLSACRAPDAPLAADGAPRL